jgi:hypothetical protein
LIIIKGAKLPKVKGITLFPFIFLSTKLPSKILVNHERIHIRQQMELLIIPFYLWYGIEWIIHYFQVRNFWIAYRMISFEKEAYAMEHDLNYLKNRKFWEFLKFL